jgi:hypothetical protein
MKINQCLYMRDVMKILAIRIGDRYGPEYETYLERK